MKPFLFLLTASLPLVLLTGCGLDTVPVEHAAASGQAIYGGVHGGQQPVANSHVYIMAAGTTGYGAKSTSLLTAGSVDSTGTYVATDSSGSFALTGKYTCSAGQQIYILALGGESSPTTTNNSAIALATALGTCPTTGTFAASVPFITVNEVTTVAAAYALSGFMTGPDAVSSSSTTMAEGAVVNAFATATNLANLSDGTANASIGSNGIATVKTMNTLANIVAACINSDGSSTPCSTLFQNSTNNGVVPTDTITSLLNIAHHPSANVSTLMALSTPQSPFQPTLAANPNDFAVTVQYTSPNLSNPTNIRADAQGNIWFRNAGGNFVAEEFSPTGTLLSGTSGYAINGEGGGVSLSLDAGGNAFLANRSAFGILKLNPAGNLLSPASGYIGTCSNPNANLAATSIDATGSVWGSGDGGCALKISNAGTVLSGQGYPSTSGNSQALAIDSSNTAWITDVANNVVRRVSSSGSLLSEFGTSISTPVGIAIDNADTAWIANRSSDSIAHMTSSGTTMIYTGGGLTKPSDLAIDGAGTIWTGNNAPYISALTNAGVVITPSTGYSATGSGNVQAITVDSSGNVWSTVNAPDVIVEFVGLATPVAAPILPGQLGIRP